MHNWIELSGTALRHNFSAFSQLLGPERLAIVLKSNAYGHGLDQVFQCIKSENPKWICTNYLGEAERLRSLGYSGRILNVGPIFPEDIERALRSDTDIFLAKLDTLQAWSQINVRPRVHIKLDTGLSRQGFLPEQVGAILPILSQDKAKVVAICTHFANVEDVLEHQYADLQLKRFADVYALFNQNGFKLMRHAASSASSLIFDQRNFDLCRVGISLYGFWPSQPTKLSYRNSSQQMIELKPALSWKTRVNLIKTVAAGDFIGYGCTYRAPKPMQVALIPVGYFEGYPRIASNGQAYVLIRGNRCPLVGRISMNMLTVDISNLAKIEIGDEVVLIGEQQGDHVAAADVASWAQSIHYELVTRLHGEIPRRVID
jgi:alanine racemase